ncbi:MAG: sulfatase [Planctomycetaceae bacterium]|nr:sulfatase [Planctomycetaceae bacterium]
MKQTVLWIAVLVVALLSNGTSDVVAADRPNILWIYLEDVSGWFSCYGETLIETPNIDALARSGTRFTRFYTPAGVCSATRSAIMLGVMQTTFGNHQHRSSRNIAKGTKHDGVGMIHLPDGVRTLPELFRAHGYYTFNEGGKQDYNFVFDEADLYDYVPKHKGWGPESVVAGDCWKRRKPGQPFFGQVQLGGGKLGKAAPEKMVPSRVPVPPYYPDIPEVRQEIAHHYDCLVKTDEQVGDIIAALRRDGLYDNTLIVLFSDHGYKLHRHKQFLYEGGIQMPLIISGPKIEAGTVRDDLISGIDLAPMCLAYAGADLPEYMEGRNFLAQDYSPREYIVAARDRCDFTIEHIRAIVTPQFKYLRNYLTDRPYMQPSYKDPWPVTIRLREMMEHGQMNDVQQIFFSDRKPAEELYDLRNDPHEIHNLADDPALADQLERHRELLQTWITQTGDKGQQPESDEGLIQVLYEWGDYCVNPEYDHLRSQIDRSAIKRKRTK